MTSITARADRRLIRANHKSQRFVFVELTAPPATQARKRPPVNLAFVLDRSGSMSGGKLELAKRAVEEAIGRLDAHDRFSVVVYDEVIDVAVETTPASAEARHNAVTRLASIEARGSTNLGEGWLRGCEQVAAHLSSEGVDRCLLLTDGLANVGVTNSEELAHHATELRARGVSTTTFGVGNDFDEQLLQAMADAGGGHFYYIADAAQIRDHIASEVGETLEVVARDVELEFTVADGVQVEPISPHPAHARGSRAIVVLGDLVADQAVDVVLRLTFPYGQVGRETGVILAVNDSEGVFGSLGANEARLTWAYADNASNDAQPRDTEVDRAVARMFASRARQEALFRNRAGDYIHARWALDATARRIRGYAGRDPELRAMVSELEAESFIYAAPMAEPDRKQRHFASSNQARTRTAMGAAIKRSR
jgi:Ca-activated chloride channel family protein